MCFEIPTLKVIHYELKQASDNHSAAAFEESHLLTSAIQDVALVCALTYM